MSLANTNTNQNNVYYEEDEIDLRELFSTIWKYKVKIVLFTSIVTLLAVIYAISKPNIYQSSAKFTTVAKKESSKPLIPELEGYVDLSFGSVVGQEIYYKELADSYDFMKKFIIKYKLYQKLQDKGNFIYPFGFKTQSDIAIEDIKEPISSKQEALIYDAYKTINANLSIKTDKKTSLITVSYSGADRFLNKQILDGFLQEASLLLQKNELTDIDNKIKFYKKEISSIRELELKNKLTELVAVLIKKKIFSKAEKFYGLKVIKSSEVSHPKDKIKPKRALIVIVAFVTSFILALFLVFFIEFIKNSTSNTKPEIESDTK